MSWRCKNGKKKEEKQRRRRKNEDSKNEDEETIIFQNRVQANPTNVQVSNTAIIVSFIHIHTVSYEVLKSLSFVFAFQDDKETVVYKGDKHHHISHHKCGNADNYDSCLG